MKSLKIATVILGLVVGFLLLKAEYSKSSPGSIFQLLTDPKIHISSAKFYVLYAQPTRAVQLTNTETLNYLGRLLSAPTEGSVSGYSHRICIKLSNGQEFDLWCVLAYDGESLAIGIEQGIFADAKFYTFHLTQDSPEELSKAFQNLIKAQNR